MVRIFANLDIKGDEWYTAADAAESGVGMTLIYSLFAAQLYSWYVFVDVSFEDLCRERLSSSASLMMSVV